MYITFVGTYYIFLIFFMAVTSGNKLYNWNSEICCNGKVHSVNDDFGFSSGLKQCCGQEIMIKDNDEKKWPLCCDGNVHYLDKVSYNDFECCGKDLIDKYQFRCFKQFKRVQIPDKDQINDKLGFCETSEDGWTFYDEKLQQCCEGNLFDFDEEKQCWGSEYVNRDTHFFCNQYNVLDGTSIVKAIPLGNRNSSNTDCCNFQLFDVKTQICLINKVINRNEKVVKHCCGYTYSYNWTSSSWDAEKNRNSLDDEDCNQLIFSHPEYLCFKNQLSILSLGENICSFIEKPYKTGLQACCSSGIIDLSPKDIENVKTECCE